MKGTLPSLLVLAVLASASCSTDKSTPTKPSPPVIGNALVFSSNRGADGLFDLYTCNADGTGFHRLTSDTLLEVESRWSPDGSKIAFIETGDSLHLTVMDADGTNRARLIHEYYLRGFSWSLDGSQIAYQSGYSNGQAYPLQLWVMNANGTSPHLVIDYDSLNGVSQISWTPRNTFLGADGLGLVEFDADGKNRRRILTKLGVGDYPQMSPDGSKIAFGWTGEVGYTPNIYVVDADGTGLKQLTDNVNESNHPVWSPDGSRIAFHGPGQVLWTMNADGSDQQRIMLPKDFWGNVADYLGGWK